MAYRCSESGCSSVFKRPEHLSRHKLNHKPRRIYQCDLCGKDFVRRDLLRRHASRHERGMSYRNSGGYSNTGRPDSATPSAPVTPCPTVLCEPVQPPPDQQMQDAVAPEATPADTDQGLPLSPPPVQVQDGLEMPWSSDPEYYTFFDGPSDAGGLTQDLDWLFGHSPNDGSFDALRGLQVNSVHVAVTSPGYETSSQGSLPASYADAAYLLPRESILATLASLPPNILGSSFFDAANLDMFMRNYWRQFNPHFSLLHEASFSVQDAPPLLLLSLLTLGATLSPDEEHYAVAEHVHQNLRSLIFASPWFQPPAPLWVVQALLVVQAYEKMFSSRKLHEMSHVFHYSVITLMRRGSSYSPDREDEGEISSTERAWHRWIERESSYRAAYFAFIMDAQHSSIFGHTAALSLSDIRLPLPCADVIWDAATATQWERARARTAPPPQFLAALRALLSRRPIPQSYSPFARFVLLHGLLCVTRHMITRDQTASCINVAGQPPPDIDSGASTPHEDHDNWKDRLDRAIDTWSLSLLSQAPSLCLEAARPLQRIAHVVIHISVLDFHILAGAPNLATGTPVRTDSAEFRRAHKKVLEWARHRNAKRTLSHCLMLIQEIMFTRTRYLAVEDNISLRPWVLYHATLVLWAYGAIVEAHSGATREEGEAELRWSAEEYLAHMLNELMGDGELAQLQGAHCTGGLILAVRTALEGCRWELLREAQETLGNLLENPSRLKARVE
ncbi:hypothetical protein GQ53DRAFT_731226 [Thozetella sp. PMI_491]|nr:hypothetical protein GQ53DRAFT_731226 [Thozetella sp. PMI_491]